MNVLLQQDQDLLLATERPKGRTVSPSWHSVRGKAVPANNMGVEASVQPFPILIAVSLASQTLPTQPPPQIQTNQSIVEAEWTFIRNCERAGINASFLEAFHPEGLIFRPQPANGKEWYAKQPETKSRLSWVPAFSFTAASKDLGYNTGPWDWRPGPGAEPKAFGWFFSVWKRNSAGAWKLFWDIGIPTREAAFGVAALRVTIPSRKETHGLEPLSEAQALELDKKFAAKVKSEGIENAYQTHLAPEGQVFRSPAQPLAGWTKARTLLLGSPGLRTWEPRGAAVARSGEILFVHGAYARDMEGKPPESGTYVRVWRRMGAAWTLELDLESPQPPKAEK
jgi:hypothetical protein